MKEKNRLQRAATAAYAVVFVLVLIFSVYMLCAERSDIYQARPIEPYEVLEDYTEETVEDPSAPEGIRREFHIRLGNITATKDYLAFYAVHQYSQVYIDGELVYSIRPDEHNRVGASPSSYWVFIPLDQTDNGKDVRIVITPVFKSSVERDMEFLLGARSDIVLSRLRTDAPQLILAVFCVISGGAIMVILPIVAMRKKQSAGGLFYLGNILFIIGVWRVTDTRVSPMLFPENPMALGYITIAALFIAFVPPLLFIKDHFSGWRKTMLLIASLGVCANAVIALTCQVFQIAELRQMLTGCHIMLLISLAVVIVAFLTKIDKKTLTGSLGGMVMLLSVGLVLDLVFFYVRKNSSGAMFTISALLLYTAVRLISEIFRMNRKIYIDAPTGLYNRSRWNALMDDGTPISETTGVMMLDLNRLKYTNDTMGHEMGDKMILDFADILRKTLPADCLIFRWGGDEFTVSTSNADREKMKRYISMISEAAEAHNASGQQPEIHFAAGYALAADYPALSHEELLKKADEKMYHNKSEWYQKNVPDYHLI